MKPLSPDTSVEAQQKQYELMRSLTPEQRLKLAFDLTNLARELVLSDLRQRYPNVDEVAIRRKFIARVLPREDVTKAYGFDPRDEPS